jgi:hypothetical protein
MGYSRPVTAPIYVVCPGQQHGWFRPERCFSAWHTRRTNGDRCRRSRSARTARTRHTYSHQISSPKLKSAISENQTFLRADVSHDRSLSTMPAQIGPRGFETLRSCFFVEEKLHPASGLRRRVPKGFHAPSSRAHALAPNTTRYSRHKIGGTAWKSSFAFSPTVFTLYWVFRQFCEPEISGKEKFSRGRSPIGGPPRSSVTPGPTWYCYCGACRAVCGDANSVIAYRPQSLKPLRNPRKDEGW